MSLCRGHFFFMNNTSILRVGIKRSLQNQICSSFKNQGMTGSSRSVTISHYMKRLFTSNAKVDQSMHKVLNGGSLGQPSGPLGRSFFTSKTVSNAFSGAKRTFSTSVAPRFRMSIFLLNDAVSSAATSAAKSASNAGKRVNPWPINTAKPLGYLCIGCSILVFAIVVLGGLTRLTESGLSITEWKPITGAIPPLNEQQWQEEFEKYQQSPEFKELNTQMTLKEYKFIYGMEWSHRLLGRIIGVLFVVPSLYYIARRRVSAPTAWKLLGICGLMGLQGFVGWWMVYSGIDKNQLEERHSKPTVSQYRLATHLAVAFTVYCCMISTGFSILRDYKIMANPQKYEKVFRLINSSALKPFRRMTKGVFGMVFITAMTGALVAGLDAGMIYNTFPKMGDGYMPPKDELMDPMFARKSDKSDLWWRNILENPTTVQFDHRVFAIATFCAVFGVHMYSHRIRPIIPKAAYRWMNISVGLATLQVALGICTLLWIVPTDLGAAHQAGALALLTGMLMTVNNLKKPSVSNVVILRRYLEKASKLAEKKKLK